MYYTRVKKVIISKLKQILLCGLQLINVFKFNFPFKMYNRYSFKDKNNI